MTHRTSSICRGSNQQLISPFLEDVGMAKTNVVEAERLSCVIPWTSIREPIYMPVTLTFLNISTCLRPTRGMVKQKGGVAEAGEGLGYLY